MHLDLGIDLGTVNTRICRSGEGVVLSEPTLLARSRTATIAVGSAAQAMVGRTPPEIEVVHPLREGVIADHDAAVALLTTLIARVRRGRWWQRLRLVLSTPAGVTDVERRALLEAGRQAGAQAVHLVEEPLAGAIGADLPVAEPAGHMVVDVGGGTSEAAVIALGGFVTHQAVRVGGLHMDQAVIESLRHRCQLLVGEQTAEAVKIALGSAYPGAENTPSMLVRGRDLRNGLPRAVPVTAGEIREALAEPVRLVVDLVRSTLDSTPPELASDLVSTGILLTGGGALLAGLAQRIQEETGIRTVVAPEPMHCVAAGAARVLEGVDRLRPRGISRIR